VSWTNRHFLDYEGADDSSSTAHKTQAGPNGPENNQDLCHAFSDDLGESWKVQLEGSMKTQDVATLTSDSRDGGIISTAKKVVVVAIPKDSGIMNQEAQCVDPHGGFHVLNRDNVSGKERWKHYY